MQKKAAQSKKSKRMEWTQTNTEGHKTTTTTTTSEKHHHHHHHHHH
jgi:hypothetical protein